MKYSHTRIDELEVENKKLKEDKEILTSKLSVSKSYTEHFRVMTVG